MGSRSGFAVTVCLSGCVPASLMRTIGGMKVFALLSAVLLLGACSSMLLGGNASGGSGLGVDNRSSAQISADNAIAATIRNRFAADTALNEAGLVVNSENYAVTVSGQVSAFADRDRALQIARNTDGVRSVNNQVSVNTRQ